MMNNTNYANNSELILYESDNSNIKGTPSKVAFPETEDEIINLIKNTKSDIIPRGAGTNYVGAVTPNDSLIICTKKMKKVIDFDAKTKTIYTESGATIKELNEKLKAIGFEFPIHTNPESTLGGMIALNTLSNLGKYGNMKEHLEEIEFINGRGELTQISKGDLSDICGMEGTTGIITRAKIKIIPIPKRSASIFQSEDIEELITVSKRLMIDKEIVSLKFYSPTSSKIIGLPEKNNLIIIFSSNRGKIIGDEYKKLEKLVGSSINKLRSNDYTEIEESRFILNKLEDFILFISKNRIPFFGDFTSDSIYTFFRNNDKTQEDIRNIIRKMSGRPFLGIGLKRKNILEPLRRKILQRVKQRYDPFFKLNKGKLIDIVKKEKTNPEKPEEKMNQFILKVEDTEKDSLNNQLEDYKYTFQPEPNPENKKEIESFSKNIPKEINQFETQLENQLKTQSDNQSEIQSETPPEPQPEPPHETHQETYLQTPQETHQETNPQTHPQETPPGKTTTSDNLDRTSKSEEDLIRDIMFNKTNKPEEQPKDDKQNRST